MHELLILTIILIIILLIYNKNSSLCGFKHKKHNVVSTSKAPSAIGPFSQALIYNDIVYISGSLGLVPETMNFQSETDVEIQTHQVMKNLSSVIKASGSSMNKVLKTNIFLTDINDFAKINKIYETYFANHKPARSTVAVKDLPRNALIEIDAIAYI